MAAPVPEVHETPARPVGDPKSALLAAIREKSKPFYSMVVAQARSIEFDGETLAFTFAAVHRHLRAQLEGRRQWLAQIAQATIGRPVAIAGRELEPDPSAAPAEAREGSPRRADLEARARSEPAVQAVLDVFGAEIEDIEEIS